MISKSLFVKTIEALQEQYHHDKVCAEKLCELFNCEISGAYNTSYLSNAILELLRVHFPKDADGHCEIEHFAYVLNFGKIGDEYESAEELYDRLVKENPVLYRVEYSGDTAIAYRQDGSVERAIAKHPSPDPNNI